MCDCDNGMLLAADARDDQPCPNCTAGERARRFIHNYENGLEPHNPGYMDYDDE